MMAGEIEMPENRAEQLQRFRAAHAAQRLDVLTICSPYCVESDRYILLEREQGDATFTVCRDCDFSTPFDRGEIRPVAGYTLDAFQREINEAAEAWLVDYIPEGVYDGPTMIFERVEAEMYRRVRMMAPSRTSSHGRMLAAWERAFPVVRRSLR